MRFFLKLVLVWFGASFIVCSANAVSDSEKLILMGKKMNEAIQFADAKLWQRAHTEARKIPNKSADDIISWLKLRAAVQDFKYYESFLLKNSDWPGIEYLRIKGEYAITPEVEPERVKAYFSSNSPQTGHGAVRLALAMLSIGEITDALNLIKQSWLIHSYSEQDFKLILGIFAESLSKMHVQRLDNLLWAGKLKDAKKMLKFVNKDFTKVAEARIALQSGKAGVDQILKALPDSYKSHPGLVYDRLRFRRNKKLFETAEDLIISTSKGASKLGRPLEWVEAREFFSRKAFSRGDAFKAYQIASKHFVKVETPKMASRIAHLEWFSGFISLNFLDKPQNALFHFEQFSNFSTNPVNKSKAYYWLGRTYETLGNKKEASQNYALAANYQNFFYGQLGMERGKIPFDRDAINGKMRYDWTESTFLEKSSVKAAILLFYADRSVLSDRFFNHSSEKLSSIQRLQLSQLTKDLGLMSSGISIFKTAAASGSVLPNFAYPQMDLSFIEDESLKPLITAIIRQESSFYTFSRSSAGALGLMQLMPTTAKDMSRRLGLSYNESLLLSDKTYNIKIGTKFLTTLLKRFDGNLLLSVAAYNAGPKRVLKWISEFGDPRLGRVDKAKWLESIPFSETRNYVKRVLEAEKIYKLKMFGY